MNDVRFAPGCFGSSTQFAHDDVCGACPFAAQCEPKHLEALAALRRYFGIETGKGTRGASPKSANPGALSARTMRYLTRAGKTVQQIADDILAGKNPFPANKGDFLFVVTEMLRLSSQKGFIQEAAMIDRLAIFQQVAPVTARYYVRTVIQILDAAGVTTRNSSGIALKRG